METGAELETNNFASQPCYFPPVTSGQFFASDIPGNFMQNWMQPFN
jgi:hypothetical protein